LPEDVAGIKIMTWNVHLFDLGEWTRDKAAQGKILDLIKQENPDILCLQEFYMDKAVNAEPYTFQIRQLGYPYFEFSGESRAAKRFINISAGEKEVIEIGHAVFSKYPLSNARKYILGEKNYNMMSVDVTIDSIRSFNLNVLHLRSVRFRDDDINYIESVKRKGAAAEETRKSKLLLFKLRDAFSERAAQANIIDSVKKETDLPRVICGDFNDVPNSYAYFHIRTDRQDAFLAKDFGIGRTFNAIAPTLRIDYILPDKNFEIQQFDMVDEDLSDHLMLVTDLRLKK